MNHTRAFFRDEALCGVMLSLLLLAGGSIEAQELRKAGPTPSRLETLSNLGKTISVSFRDVALRSVLSEISQKANIRFSYSEDEVLVSQGVTLSAENVTVAEALSRLLEETSIDWIPMNAGWVVLTPRGVAQQETGTIRGTIVDDAGEPIAFANVLIEGTTRGAAANVRGEYTIGRVPPGTYRLRASAIGYRAQSVEVTVRAGETTTHNFQLTPDILRFEEVVVTGTMSPRQKLESTVAISTISPQELVQSNPRSTTEMLRYVPGFTRVESSGGEVNQNISVRGILGVEYVMFMEDGLPVFPTMHTFFMNADNLFRPDENIDRIEVVRGGSSALFGSNTPGAIINFVNKTGGPELRGSMRAVGGTQGLARYDFNVHGPLEDLWRFNLGGFYRYDKGVRNPGFPGIRGGQLKASVTRLLDNGFVRLSGKFIDDRNQFILPLPFENPDNPTYVKGFSRYGAMSTNEGNHIKVPIPTGELTLPLEDGLRTNAYWLTADIGFEFTNDWNLRNTAQIMKNDQAWNAIVPFDLMTSEEWIGSLNLPANSNPRLFYTNHFDSRGQRLPFDRTYNNLVAPGGLWHVQKPISAFQNQLTVNKKVNNHRFTAGLYLAHYTQQNRWHFTEIITDVRDNPRFLDLVYTDPATNQRVERTKNGFRRYISFYVNGSGQTTIFSGVLGAELQITDRLRADLGVRYEWNEFVQTVENLSDVDLDNNPRTVYNNIVWGNGSFRHFLRTMDDYAVSGGLKYRLTDDISLYTQASRAFKMPALDEFLFAQAEQQVELFEARETIMAEGGVKYASPRLGATLNAFWGELKNIVGQGAEANPATGEITWVLRASPENRAFGVEAEFSASPIPMLNILGSGTFIGAQTVPGTGAAVTAGGIPSTIGNLAMTYTISGIRLLADLHYVGLREMLAFPPYDSKTRQFVKTPEFPDANPKKIGELKAYTYLNLGVSYTLAGQALTVSADLLNVTQSTGLEEGNPRLPAAGGKNIFLARPLLPRRLTVSLSYYF
jgi:outer membrane receptor protein involved in Fe transport